MSEIKSVRRDGTLTRRRVAWIAASVGAVVLIGCATYYLSIVTVARVNVHGSIHASVETVVDLAGVASGDTLYRVDTGMIESRVALHPWIERAEVTRWPTGVLAIEVHERTPVVLSVSASGQPVFYIDRTGASLPVDSVSTYDVPLLRGIANGNRPAPISDSATVELLEVIASLPPSVDGLLSDLIVRPDGEVDAITVPVDDGTCIRVRLGRGEYDRKMKTLRAFWTQAVAGFPRKRIEWIDLRFRGQVITKEESVIS